MSTGLQVDRRQIKNIDNPLVSASFNWSQTPGGSLSVGSNTITLSPVPVGVNGTNTGHRLWIENEVVTISGGTAVSGAASGTIVVTCANTHSGAWTVRSATAGVQEAIWAAPSTGAAIRIPSGQFTIYGPVKFRSRVYTPVSGNGPMTTVLNVPATFPLTAPAVFEIPGPGVAPFNVDSGVNDLTIQFAQPDTTNFASYVQYPWAIYIYGTWHVVCSNLQIGAAWDGIKVNGVAGAQGGVTLNDIQMSAFHRAFNLDASYQPTIIHNCTVDSGVGLTNNQTTAILNKANGATCFDVGRVDGLKVSNFTTNLIAGSFHLDALATFGAVGSFSNCWFDLGGLTFSECSLVFAGCNFGTGSAIPSFTMTGGQVIFVGCRFATLHASDLIICSVDNGFNVSQYLPLLSLTGCSFNTFNQDVRCIRAETNTFAGVFNVSITGCTFQRNPGIAYTQPTIRLAPGGAGAVRGTVTGNIFHEAAGGSGVAVQITTDDFHSLAGNTRCNWALSLPATQAKLNLDDLSLQDAIGSTVVSASTIAPTGPIFAVSGTNAINTISAPVDFPYKRITIIPLGAFTWTTAGNIPVSGTAVVGRALDLVFNASTTKWYPSYV